MKWRCFLGTFLKVWGALMGAIAVVVLSILPFKLFLPDHIGAPAWLGTMLAIWAAVIAYDMCR